MIIRLSLFILGCISGCKSCNNLIINLICGAGGTTDSHPAYARQAAPAPAADFQDAPHGGEEICRDCLVAFVVRQDGGSGNDQGTPNLTK